MLASRHLASFAMFVVLVAACGTGTGASPDTGPVQRLPDGAVDHDATTPVSTQRFTCMGCPTTAFPEPGAPACSADAASRPRLVYPPDGVLLPPNLNVIEIQFDPGVGNTLWEVDFANASTDVRATTTCSPITSVRGRTTTTCGFSLPQEVWDAMVAPNRGRDPIVITVRGTNATATCTSTADATRRISFAQQDITGGIYYWQSAVFGGAAGRTGGIYLHDFGARDPMPTPFLESGSSGRCTGCHNLSRDGERISVGLDDPDADDEFGDVTSQLLRVQDKSVVSRSFSPGFQTFTSDHSRMLASNYRQRNASFQLYDGESGTMMQTVDLPAAGTQPDWSADNRHIVYVQPANGSIWDRGDHHFHGGDLYTMDVDAAYAFGAPRSLLPGDLHMEDPMPGAGNYYPSWSPDGAFIIFNHIHGGDIFYNRSAQIWLATSDGQHYFELANLEGGNDLTNSWPRWSPFVQPYRGGHILWVTFSSNRNYGAHIDNDGLPNCYPPASPSEDMPQSADWSACQQPQIWMAAVGVDTDEFGNGRDTSYPAFWLPFQDVASHNHSAQWTAHVVAPTCVDAGGMCGANAGQECCSGMVCDETTHHCGASCVPVPVTGTTAQTCPGPHGEPCCNGATCDATTHTCQAPPG